MLQDVLIVDDDQAMCEILSSVCELAGVSFRVARDGMDAIEQIKSGHPALIILDLMMPRLDGHGVVKYLKSCPDTTEIPVLLYTAHYLPDEKRAQIPLPAEMIVNKSQLSVSDLEVLIKTRVTASRN